MKKTVALALVIFMLIGTLCACGSNGDNAAVTADTTVDAGETDIVDESTTSSEPDYEYFTSFDIANADSDMTSAFKEAREAADSFVESLVSHSPGDEVNGVSDYVFSYTELSQMVVNSADITDVVCKTNIQDELRVEYTVKLDVSGADGVMFKEGENEWMLVYQPNLFSDSSYKCFCPSEIYRKIDMQMTAQQKTINNYCEKFATYISGYYGNNDVDDIDGTIMGFEGEEKSNFISMLLMFLVGVKADESFTGDFGYPVSTVSAAAQRVLGISPEFFSDYDADEMIELPYLGGSWCYSAMAGYTSDAEKTTVTMNYYADSMYTFIAKTIKYELKSNGDGTYCLLSQQVIYDSGYYMYIDSV